MDMNDFQERTEKLITDIFGKGHLQKKKENALRMLEEALELAQAYEIDRDLINKITNQVYNKPVGDKFQEMAQTAIQLFRIAGSEGYWLQAEIVKELDRISDPEIQQKIRDKHQLKIKAY